MTMHGNFTRIYCLPSSIDPSLTPLYAQSQAALIPSDAYLQKELHLYIIGRSHCRFFA